jgi:GAF domain-containing protein/HAMP domain-containing protein
MSKKSSNRRSLAATLATTFVLLSIVFLLLMSSFQIYLNFQAEQEAISSQQQLIASGAAKEVSSFIEQMFGVLETAARIGHGSPAVHHKEEESLPDNLLGAQEAFRKVILLDKQGRLLGVASRLSLLGSAELDDYSGQELFSQVRQGRRYIGPIHIDETTSEPLVIMAVPVIDVFGEFQGAIVAEVNLKFMWELVRRLQIGQTGQAYVVDRQGNLIAFGDTSRILKGENLKNLEQVSEFINNPSLIDQTGANLSTGINGNSVLATYVPLGTPDWAVMTEIPVTEAYQGVIQNARASLVILAVIAVLAGIAGVYASRRLAKPLLNLTQSATRIAEGELHLAAAVEGPLESARLADAFNSMTAQLRDLIGTLEQRIEARTQRLEVLASLSEHLVAILNLEELLVEVVNQVKTHFGYYHAHIYLIDDKREYLIMSEGAGEAGRIMKARGHSIPFNAPTSLVARAARTGEVVRVDNVREAEDWLPNPLLPGTYSEMAVPIIVEGQVVGVLDVQSDKIAGLDEGDASVLRSLANQVAVAIRNARLFAQVETVLAETQAAQENYLQQAWRSSYVGWEEYLYRRPGAPPLNPALKIQLDQEAGAKNEPVIITAAKGHPLMLHSSAAETLDSEQIVALVAPIKLQNQIIGVMEFLETDLSRRPSWSEQELALVQAIADQVAQTAETLRLFEETQERASRERTIREITNRLRTAPSLERLVDMATEELAQRLSATHAKLELGLKTQQYPATNGSNGREEENNDVD